MASQPDQRSPKNLRTRYLTVGQTARIVGVSPSTLRLWENVGLVSPARSAGRYRLYNPDVLEVLKRIKYLRDVKKLSVPGIKEVLGKNRRAGAGPNPNHRPDIGRRLRKLRQRLDLGLVEAAARAKISAGFLSAIEMSRANPSIATLQRLASSYNTTVLEFFDVPHRSRRLIRPSQRRVLRAAKESISSCCHGRNCSSACFSGSAPALAVTAPTRTRAKNLFSC